MLKSSKTTTTSRTLFTLLVATAVIPLPAMTPALLSGAVGAMSLISAPAPARPAGVVPIYFIPTRPNRAPAMLPETVLLSISEPKTIITESGVEQALPFEDLRVPTVVSFDPPRLPTPWQWLTRPGGGGGGVTSPVPEPATWAMLIFGFMLTGGFIRRHRRQAALAA